MERAGKLQCIIDSNIYDKARRGGCRHVINLHGSIYQNQCPRCKKKYSIGYMAGAKRVPICRDCNVPIRPMISLIGEMVDLSLIHIFTPAGTDIFPFMNRQYPSATHITSVHTMAVELATEVWFSDSNHAVKCRARNLSLIHI